MDTELFSSKEGLFIYLTTTKSNFLLHQQQMQTNELLLSHQTTNHTNILKLINSNETCMNLFCNNISIQFSFKNVILALFLISVELLTLLGNILVILAIFVDYHLRSPAHYLMGSLALADLLLATLVLPFSSFQLYFDSWIFGEKFCEMWLAIDVLCCTASINLVLVISIDRYIGITRPLRYNMIITKGRILCIIIFVWSLSLVVSLAPQLGLKSPQLSNRICEVNEDTAYVLFSASFSFYIPLLIILIVYYRIFKEARAQTKFLKTGTKTSKGTDGSGVTLRVHIGPSNQRKTFQQCTCKINNNGHISPDKNSFKNEINEQFNNYSNDKNKKNLIEKNHLIPETKANSSEKVVSGSSNNKKNLINNKANLFTKNKNSSTISNNICKYCSLPINSNGTTLIKNNLTGSSGLLSSKIAKFKNEQKAAKTLAIVVGCFIFCWLPFFITLTIESLKICSIPKTVFLLVFWLGYCNSAMNPLIYGLSSREFRRAYKGILRCNLKYRKRKEREKILKIKFKSNLNQI